FHRHHQLDNVEGIGAQIFDEGGLRLDLVLPDPQLLRDDALDLGLDRHAQFLSGNGPEKLSARPCSTEKLKGKTDRVTYAPACRPPPVAGKACSSPMLRPAGLRPSQAKPAPPYWQRPLMQRKPD